MREGFLLIGDPLKPAGKLSILTNTPHPAHVTLMDVDGDGLQDFLVADLGEFFPDDHQKGAVIWLRRPAEREVRDLLAGWLATRRRRGGRGLQRRTKERSCGRRLRVPYDRADRRPREPDDQSASAARTRPASSVPATRALEMG